MRRPASRSPRTSGWHAGVVGAAALLSAGAASGAAAAQSAPDPGEAVAPEWRFPVGERAEYDVTFGPMRVGRGRLQVEAVDTLRGTPAYRVAFEIEGGPFFYRIDDRSASWVAPRPFRSLRFEQILNEGDYHRHRRYELDQASGTYTREDWDRDAELYRPHPDVRDVPMPKAALDEIAFLFLVRALPLEPGRTYRFERYFEEEGNPVVVEVLRRERVRTSAGRFETVVVRPIIHTGGMFGEGGRAEVYITDDDRRLIVQLDTRMKVGRLNMYLREYDPGG